MFIKLPTKNPAGTIATNTILRLIAFTIPVKTRGDGRQTATVPVSTKLP
jgi:hypothetical protein